MQNFYFHESHWQFTSRNYLIVYSPITVRVQNTGRRLKTHNLFIIVWGQFIATLWRNKSTYNDVILTKLLPKHGIGVGSWSRTSSVHSQIGYRRLSKMPIDCITFVFVAPNLKSNLLKRIFYYIMLILTIFVLIDYVARPINVSLQKSKCLNIMKRTNNYLHGLKISVLGYIHEV